ncbi:DUF4440 domain-containing protein [Sphingomonas psychrotolerans]|uniref:DUF4440 domain-containing protein n=1 Tax=Sphingomonas psychrotolerans TaxID=1327635 RepID=A0ABU3N5N1_9SPHN|nr:nuclear transport factor 2 family protein [Sphingomonas psychrotolerans]MDT8758806.1 DUF4440 domain-containing protein [Sphingomonas psychrotolerans]
MDSRLSIAALAAAVCMIAPAPAAPDPEQEIEALVQTIQRAVEARDAATLERLTHPQFEMLHGFGQIDRRDTWLALVRGGKLPRQTADIREYGVKTRVIGPVALRSAIVRFRDVKLRRDTWHRSTGTFLRDGGHWVQLRQQSSLLSDASSADAGPLADYLGEYAIPGRDGFALVEQDGLLTLRWTTGAEIPLLPQGPDRFGSGAISYVSFARSGGRVVSMTRFGGEGAWWTATRAPSP